MKNERKQQHMFSDIKWLTITEQVRDGVVIRRTVTGRGCGTEVIEREVAEKLEGAPTYQPWRNGWQRTNGCETIRVSYEKCHVDDLEATIAQIKVG